MRSITPEIKSRFFIQKDFKYYLSESIKANASFIYLNLNDNNYPSLINGTNAQDLILCRNVLIYFDSDKVATLMRKLDASLQPGGFLMLGASDPVNLSGTLLKQHTRKSSLYTKLEYVNTSPVTKTQPRATPLKANTRSTTVGTLLASAPDKESKHPNSLQSLEQLTITINKLTDKKQWGDILELLQYYQSFTQNNTHLLNSEATALANLGKLTQAIAICKQSLALDNTNLTTHFILAMTLVELNHFDEAEAELRKTLFLDPNFVEGHFQLGLLLFKNKQLSQGLKSLKNSLAVVNKKRALDIVTGFPGLNYGKLAVILEHEIAIHTAKLTESAPLPKP